MARVINGLIDAQSMALKHPDTFEAPSIEDLGRLSAGDWVKVCRNNERFWVAVIDVADGFITGKVDNHLISNRIPVGTEIFFRAKNVFEFLMKKDAA